MEGEGNLVLENICTGLLGVWISDANASISRKRHHASGSHTAQWCERPGQVGFISAHRNELFTRERHKWVRVNEILSHRLSHLSACVVEKVIEPFLPNFFQFRVWSYNSNFRILVLCIFLLNMLHEFDWEEFAQLTDSPMSVDLSFKGNWHHHHTDSPILQFNSHSSHHRQNSSVSYARAHSGQEHEVYRRRCGYTSDARSVGNHQPIKGNFPFKVVCDVISPQSGVEHLFVMALRRVRVVEKAFDRLHGIHVNRALLLQNDNWRVFGYVNNARFRRHQ
mmetsp:Transcript_6859/g.12735  ORF Transcript_6859/g.12735 Transcript_6859/m.12735 type:complete len:279 (+) Transcript_6859:203-1039(+)